MYDTASELCNEFLEIYSYEYNTLSDANKSWVINMILLIYSLKDMLVISGLKIKDRMIQQKVVRNLLIHHLCHHYNLLEEDLKEGKRLKILTPKKH